MRRLKIQSVKVITTVITAVLLFAPVFMVTSCSDSKKFEESFSKHGESLTELAVYLQDITGDGAEFYLHYDDENGTYRLSIRSEDEDFTVLDLEQETAISSKLDELRETFYEVTHRSGPNLIFVTEEFVIFAEDGYYGCMIYSVKGSVDKTTRKNWCSQEYQRFYKLSDNWYSVYIDLI